MIIFPIVAFHRVEIIFGCRGSALTITPAPTGEQVLRQGGHGMMFTTT